MHELPDDEQMLFSAELIVDADGVVALGPGPNCCEAEMRGLVQDDKLLSLLRLERKDEHPELMPEGIRGLALGVEAAAGDA